MMKLADKNFKMDFTTYMTVLNNTLFSFDCILSLYK